MALVEMAARCGQGPISIVLLNIGDGADMNELNHTLQTSLGVGRTVVTLFSVHVLTVVDIAPQPQERLERATSPR